MMRASLIAGVLLAAGAVALELRPADEQAIAPSAGDDQRQPRAALPIAAVPISAVSVAPDALLGRPLFTPGRRPPKQAAAAPLMRAGPVALPRMTGILIDGTARHAIFASAAGGRSEVVAEGGRIGAFTVRRIEPQQVTVAGPEGTRVLRTSFDPAPSATAAPAVPPGLAGLLPTSGPAAR